MSIRVHMLAKELGLTSKDLLELIQEWGLEVKNSPQAGVDPASENLIRQRLGGTSATPTPTESSPEPSSPETPTIRPSAAPPQASGASSVIAEPAAPSPDHGPRDVASPPPGATRPRPEPVEASAPPMEKLASPPESPVRPPQTPLSSAPRRSEGMMAPPTSGRLETSGPRRDGGSDRGAPGGRPAGPLAGHTPHRSGSVRAAMAANTAAAETQPGSHAPAPTPGGRPGPSSGSETKRPLERSDYISPTGTRPVSSSRPSTTPPVRRVGENQPPGLDSGRRPAPGAGRPLPPVASGGGGRPLPPIASSQAPPTRRPDGPRSGGPDVKTQAPVKRYTPEELREMMRKGQLGGAPGGPGRGPGGRPDGPGGPRVGPGAPAGPAAGGPPRAAKAGIGVAPPTGEIEDDDRKNKGARLGSPADRAGRRARRVERASERKSSISSPQPAAALLDSDDDGRRSRGPKRHKKSLAPALQRKTSAIVEPPVTIRSLSEAIGVKANELMRKFMQLTNELITINAELEDEAAVELAMEFGVELTVEYERTAEDDFLDSFEESETASEDQELRPPIVTILGHVDHGKTSLLDFIRKENVVATETGGITQHIGAYQVEHDGRKITFVDTPGHEAFTAMRARGANVTDIAVLVVAADDGVMPQTQEAIAHAKAAGVQIVVALNKIDLPGAEANIPKIFGELSKEELAPEEYGGDTPVVKTSAITGRGVPDLLETIAVIAELHEYKANPKRPGSGTCLEASLSEGRGVVATVLVQDGTLSVGDVIVCGEAFGRVRALINSKGESIQEAGPSTPVEISGLDAVPTAGEKFAVVDDVIRARSIAETRRDRSRGGSLAAPKAITLENLYSKMADQKIKSLNLILKADVQGSLEALIKELDKLQNDEVPIRILHKGVGGVGESDILLADASEAIVIGFRVAPEDRAVTLAEEKSIDIRRYDIIYQVADEVKQAIEGRLEPEIKEVHLGRAVVRQVFKISRGSVGSVAGCFVTQGVIERSAQARIIREGREIYKGSLEALRRFKDDVREVRENFECGIKIAKFDDIKVDDVIEAYRVDVIKRTL